MFALFKKELTGFLGSLSGYIVIGVFLLTNGIVLWMIPESNVLDFGYATIDPLFVNAPYVFLLLVPAITMRTFAEEKKAGTIETLFTKPISDIKIILAKYFASLVAGGFEPVAYAVVRIYRGYLGQSQVGHGLRCHLGFVHRAAVFGFGVHRHRHFCFVAYG